MRKRIVIVNQSSGHLMIDIVNAYAGEYDEVVLISGNTPKSERKLNDKVIIKNIIKYKKQTAFKRIFTWSIAFLQILFKLIFFYRKYEILYVTNPPVSYLCSFFVKNPFSVIVFDTYPDTLKNIGLKQGNWIYDLWAKCNVKIFNKAKNIFTISDGMAEQLLKYVNRERIKTIPLWSASESFKPIEKKDNAFAREYNLCDKFVVMYSGNMGRTHNVEKLVEIAKKMKYDLFVKFLFIGDGDKKENIIKFANDNNLDNCMFLDWQPYDVLPYSLATADIGVITLNDESALTSVPSKTFNLIAVGAPLLCIASQDSEISKIIKKFNNGFVCDSDNIDEAVMFIEKLAANELLKKEMSRNSLRASYEFTYRNANKYLESHS